MHTDNVWQGQQVEELVHLVGGGKKKDKKDKKVSAKDQHVMQVKLGFLYTSIKTVMEKSQVLDDQATLLTPGDWVSFSTVPNPFVSK